MSSPGRFWWGDCGETKRGLVAFLFLEFTSSVQVDLARNLFCGSIKSELIIGHINSQIGHGVQIIEV